jgi:hypothetical protein
MWLSPVPIGIGMGVYGGDCYRELRRITLPRTWVYKGEKKERRTASNPEQKEPAEREGAPGFRSKAALLSLAYGLGSLARKT